MSFRTDFLRECLILDTETTNKDAAVAELIELGFCVTLTAGEWTANHCYYRPDEPIDPEASAVNHITDEMVAGETSFRDGVTFYNALLAEIGDNVVRVAHNAVYDDTVLQRYGVATPPRPWLCTFKMSKKLYNDDPTVTLKNLSYLRYRFKLDIPEEYKGQAHSADADAMVAGKLLEYMLTELETRGIINEDEPYYEQVMEWFNEAVVITTMPFGKHKGQPLTTVPMSYWKWALNNVDSLNEDNTHYDEDLASSIAAVIEAKLG